MIRASFRARRCRGPRFIARPGSAASYRRGSGKDRNRHRPICLASSMSSDSEFAPHSGLANSRGSIGYSRTSVRCRCKGIVTMLWTFDYGPLDRTIGSLEWLVNQMRHELASGVEITAEDYRAAMVFVASVVEGLRPLQELRVEERRIGTV